MDPEGPGGGVNGETGSSAERGENGDPAGYEGSRARSRKAHLQAVLLQAATVDSIAGCLNQTYFAKRAADEIARRERYGGRLSILLMQPDFEPLAAACGDTRGERMTARRERLRGFARLVEDRLRATDLLGRWDGEQFVALLTSTGMGGAGRLARRIDTATRKHERGSFGLDQAPVLSIGVATWLGKHETLGRLLERARGGLEDVIERGGGGIGIG